LTVLPDSVLRAAGFSKQLQIPSPLGDVYRKTVEAPAAPRSAVAVELGGMPVPKGGGAYMIGKPYQVGGAWYTPREEPGYNRVGRASWYGELFHGRRTANGEIYDMDRLSAASPTLPLPVYAQVTNLANGRTIVVRVNDRGPYANDRIMDLSRRSAEVLGFRGNGTALVRVKVLGRAPLNGDDHYEQRFLASQSFMQVAAKGKSRKASAHAVASLPAENPENLQTSWKSWS
jgi:rare lipoprotein A